MAKYPALPSNEITMTLQRIKSNLFNTYDFISVWENLYPQSKIVFSGIGLGWRKVIGRNLSIYAQNQRVIKSLKKKQNGAELWRKVNL